MEMLLAGGDYTELPDAYVIFICDFDPFGEGKYRYTFQTMCRESGNADLKDGRVIMFLNPHGKNECEVPKELATLLQYMKEDLEGSEKEFHFTIHMLNSCRSSYAISREIERWRNAL